MHLNWVQNTQNNSWFDLLRLNVDSAYFNNLYGVYVIWYTKPGGGKVIKIGYGYIGERLKAEKLNTDILRYSQLGQIKVTWASVNTQNIPGIVAFLNRIYTPVVSEPTPFGTQEIAVNRIGE